MIEHDYSMKKIKLQQIWDDIFTLDPELKSNPYARFSYREPGFRIPILFTWVDEISLEMRVVFLSFMGTTRFFPFCFTVLNLVILTPH